MSAIPSRLGPCRSHVAAQDSSYRQVFGHAQMDDLYAAADGLDAAIQCLGGGVLADFAEAVAVSLITHEVRIRLLSLGASS